MERERKKKERKETQRATFQMDFTCMETFWRLGKSQRKKEGKNKIKQGTENRAEALVFLIAFYIFFVINVTAPLESILLLFIFFFEFFFLSFLLALLTDDCRFLSCVGRSPVTRFSQCSYSHSHSFHFTNFFVSFF